MQPPLLPVETLHRLLRLARLDGTVVLALASAFAIASALGGNGLEVLIGVLIAGAGALELHGAGLLRTGEVRGISWLVASQVYLLTAVLGYVTLRLISFDPSLINLIMTDALRQRYLEAGLTHAQIDQVVEWSYYLTYAIVGVVTLFYQGGMALFYFRRRDAVAKALED